MPTIPTFFPMEPNLFISRAMYRLKKRFGMPVDLYNITASAVDSDTGVRTRTLTKHRVDKAIVLDGTSWIQFEYDLSWIMAARPFSMGGHFDTMERRFIFDEKDLGDFRIEDIGDLSYLVYNGLKYAVQSKQEFENRKAVVVVGKHVPGEPFNQIYDCRVFDFGITAEVTSAE